MKGSVMAAIRMARPNFCNAHDKVGYLGSQYTRSEAFSDTIMTCPPSDEVGIEVWNQRTVILYVRREISCEIPWRDPMAGVRLDFGGGVHHSGSAGSIRRVCFTRDFPVDILHGMNIISDQRKDSYGFVYFNIDKKGVKYTVLVKGVVMGDFQVILSKSSKHDEPFGFQINVNDYSRGGDGRKDFANQFRNFNELVKKLNVEFLCKLVDTPRPTWTYPRIIGQLMIADLGASLDFYFKYPPTFIRDVQKA
ncbi:hypothetical protein MKW94_005651 [Papaver nudicaule]|uniref:PI31 proteasome regulator N-terminal domain-containing protein n=1 Tax=Papaver nudicaule TaxID=74823 RepID=A0AA42AZT4_PAPNU|nr:hypothetical protein [Papaver nudicaule]